MSGMFKNTLEKVLGTPTGMFKHKSSKTPDAPDAPTFDDAEVAGEEERQRLRRRRGMASTILAGNAEAPTTKSINLLGS